MKGNALALVFMATLCVVTACDLAPQDPTPLELSALSFNLRHDADWWEERMELIVAQILASPPDVIGLQEVELAAEQGELLEERLREAGVDYELRQVYKSGAAALGGEGIGILSLLPIEEVGVLDLSHGRVALWARLRWGQEGEHAVDFMNTHLAAREGDLVREEQMEAVLAFLDEKEAELPQVLVGDMNAVPTDPAITRALEAGYRDAWLEANGSEEGGSTSSIALVKEPLEQTPTRRIDYVFVRGALEVRSCEIAMDQAREDGLMPSDHLGVGASLRGTPLPKPNG